MALAFNEAVQPEESDNDPRSAWVRGPTVSLSTLARRFGIPPSTLRSRARREHWDELRRAFVATEREEAHRALQRQSARQAVRACRALLYGIIRRDRPARIAQLAREAAEACNAVAAYHTMNNVLALVVFHDLIPGAQRLPFHAWLPIHLFA